VTTLTVVGQAVLRRRVAATRQDHLGERVERVPLPVGQGALGLG
jgi:hypothetical protein